MLIRTCLCLITRPAGGGGTADGAGDRVTGDRAGGGVTGDGARRTAGGPRVTGDGAGRELLLGYKKRGFGAGRWVGLGGHVEEGEASADAAAREVREESGLLVPVQSLAHMATLRFAFPARPSWDQVAEVFLTTDFAGQPAESEEVVPRWFAMTALPFDAMWDDARYWLPAVLSGRRVSAQVVFAADCATVAMIRASP